MTCNNEGKEAGGDNSVEDEGEEDLGAVYADVPVASVNSSRTRAHYSSSAGEWPKYFAVLLLLSFAYVWNIFLFFLLFCRAGKKRQTVTEDDQSATRKADTDFDSLFSGDTGRSPPIGSSSNSGSNSNSAGDELDTQDSTRYMDCGDGGDGGESTPQDETPSLCVAQPLSHTHQSQSTGSASPSSA